MYPQSDLKELVDKAVNFHGHWCPGLARGVRVAAWAMGNFGTALDEEIVTITETDMCAVDAIQALVGCTFGKGNLIFRDRGKVAFSFYRRSDGKSARVVERSRDDERHRRIRDVREQLSAPHLPDWKRADLEVEAARLRKEDIEFLLSAPFEELFEIKSVLCDMPDRAQRLPTILCESCGEGVMATRIIECGGRQLCMDCAKTAQA